MTVSPTAKSTASTGSPERFALVVAYPSGRLPFLLTSPLHPH